jgi:hypothetical protein
MFSDRLDLSFAGGILLQADGALAGPAEGCAGGANREERWIDQTGECPASNAPRCQMLTVTAASTGWIVGLVLGVVVIAVAAVIVIVIVALAIRIARQAKTAEQAVEVVRAQTAELGGVARINDSGVRILHAARALRKVAVGR